jgi:Ti type entry exclusion protein TrbK
MVRGKLIIAIAADIVCLGGAGLWMLASERHTAQERRKKFYAPRKEYPTSGGEKMKVEW